ncbi:MAG: hypothetical protein ACI9G1_005763, partial [Pirellulaceae bacterium]
RYHEHSPQPIAGAQDMKWIASVIAVLAIIAISSAAAADENAVSNTFSPSESRFSRLGCSAGSCHGMVKGGNGFRLSLFGVDPKRDHDSLLKEFAARRVNHSNTHGSSF